MYRDDGFDFIRDYIDWLSPLLPESMMFRGHANLKWQVEPSAFRIGMRGIDNIVHLRMWKELGQRFVNPKPANPLEWLVLAQHYGIPTALLDWTSNPLTALFFACQGAAIDDVEGVVIGVDRDSFDENMSRISSNPFCLSEDDESILINASGMNSRSMAQDSYMSLHHRESISYFLNNRSSSQFLIPCALNRKILEALSLLGVSEERLYTDLSSAVIVFKRELAALNAMSDLLNGKQ